MVHMQADTNRADLLSSGTPPPPLKAPLTSGASEPRKEVGLNELYQEVILEHSRRPRFKQKPSGGCQFCQDGKNPLCGDEITLFCKVTEETASGALPRISVSYEGKGCSISQASASIMCDSIQSCLVTDARKKIEFAESVYTGKVVLGEDDIEEDVEALFGVSKFPVRVKCAALPWKTLEIILDEKFNGNGQLQSTAEVCAGISLCTREPRKLRVVSTED